MRLRACLLQGEGLAKGWFPAATTGASTLQEGLSPAAPWGHGPAREQDRGVADALVATAGLTPTLGPFRPVPRLQAIFATAAKGPDHVKVLDKREIGASLKDWLVDKKRPSGRLGS